jgi:hypothetical protein
VRSCCAARAAQAAHRAPRPSSSPASPPIRVPALRAAAEAHPSRAGLGAWHPLSPFLRGEGQGEGQNPVAASASLRGEGQMLGRTPRGSNGHRNEARTLDRGPGAPAPHPYPLPLVKDEGEREKSAPAAPPQTRATSAWSQACRPRSRRAAPGACRTCRARRAAAACGLTSGGEAWGRYMARAGGRGNRGRRITCTRSCRQGSCREGERGRR